MGEVEDRALIHKKFGQITKADNGSPVQERLIDDVLPLIRRSGSMDDWLDFYELLPRGHLVIEETRERISQFHQE